MKQVLFVGNSYTYYNDMPETIFEEKAAEAGYPCRAVSVTRGGWYLSRFADPENEEGKRLRDVIKNKHFDAVVLQDQSCNPALHPEAFLESVGDMKALLQDKTDMFVLYATWGRKDGSPDLEKMEMTRPQMTEKLATAYEKAGERYGMRVAHVGRAFAARMAAEPEVELYNADMTHPSYLGSQIAADTILAAILEK